MTRERLLAVIFSILALATVASFAEDTPNQTKRIVILGDSISAGYGLDRKEAFPSLLQDKIREAGLPYTVVNAGVSGDTTAGGLRRLEWALGKQGADVLVIALGGNDGLRGTPPEQTEKNLTAMVQKARTLNPATKILICGMQMPNNLGTEYVESFKAVFSDVAKKTNTEFLPFLLEGVGGKAEFNLPDRIHPNAKGQEMIADLVWAKLHGML